MACSLVAAAASPANAISIKARTYTLHRSEGACRSRSSDAASRSWCSSARHRRAEDSACRRRIICRPSQLTREASLRSVFLGAKMNAEGLIQRGRNKDAGAGERDEQLEQVRDAVNNVRARSSLGGGAGKGGVKTLAIAIAIPLVAGIVDAVFNSPFSQWYKDLNKPWWNPPGPIFGMAWSLLYPLMGLASWLVWVEGGIQKQAYPLALYAVQLVLNLAWPALFFGAHNIPLALADITLLVGVLALTVASFKPVNEVAANLMLPYVVWVTFAAILTFNLWLNNRGGSGGDFAGSRTE